MKISNFILCVALACGTSLVSGCETANKGIAKYDTLVDKDEACTAAWADYEANLQRRADMIPQLVAVVKGSAAHEESTLTEVTQARASATQMKLDAKAGDFEDPDKFKQFAAAQNTLGTAMSRLMVANEKYPDLKANAAFHDLQVQIEGTENRLMRAREVYNAKVLDFNTELRHVSGKVINPVTGHEFKPKAYFEASADAKVAPKIDFSNSPKIDAGK